MPQRVEFELDAAGVREVLESPEVRQMVDEAAGQVAERVRAAVPAPETVEAHPYTTDRQAARVTVADRRAMAWQAKDGILTRAAAGIGADVKERGGR
ncbi:hypothetical protein [Streptomyces sp. LS1784]|uniref:hypothetical protein n=1 Tax=Streptomyces sp. LS1784 TaxID=2851533 RepID=UPI001CC9FBF6|nr:hypothetical protein [Streptomyces sp. LS1784]